MRKRSSDVLWLWISIISFFAMSVMFLIMPIGSATTDVREVNTLFIVGGCFWTFMVIGVIAQIVFSKKRKAWYKAQRINIKRSSVKRVGAISFFSCREAVIADLIVIAALTGLIVSALLTHATGYVCYVFLALLSFAFCMHCILNGKIYYHITHHFDAKGTHAKKDMHDYDNEEGDR